MLQIAQACAELFVVSIISAHGYSSPFGLTLLSEPLNTIEFERFWHVKACSREANEKSKVEIDQTNKLTLASFQFEYMFPSEVAFLS